MTASALSSQQLPSIPCNRYPVYCVQLNTIKIYRIKNAFLHLVFFWQLFFTRTRTKEKIFGSSSLVKNKHDKENGYIFFYANEIKSQNTMLINVQRIRNIKMFFFLILRQLTWEISLGRGFRKTLHSAAWPPSRKLSSTQQYILCIIKIT